MNTKAKLIAAVLTTAIFGTGAIAMTQDQPTPVQQILATPEASPVPTPAPITEPVITQATPVPTVAPVPIPTPKPVVTPPVPDKPITPKPTPRPIDNGDGSVYVDDTPNGLPPVVVPMPTPRVR